MNLHGDRSTEWPSEVAVEWRPVPAASDLHKHCEEEETWEKTCVLLPLMWDSEWSWQARSATTVSPPPFLLLLIPLFLLLLLLSRSTQPGNRRGVLLYPAAGSTPSAGVDAPSFACFCLVCVFFPKLHQCDFLCRASVRKSDKLVYAERDSTLAEQWGELKRLQSLQSLNVVFVSTDRHGEILPCNRIHRLTGG